MELPLRAVYFDENHDSSWISKATWGTTISNHFAERGYSRLDALGLARWLEGHSAQASACRSTVVFAQDLIPTEICPDASANNPVRHYLDNGGRVVWIGDIPFWSKSLGAGKEHEQIWRYGTHFANLGVQPLFADSSSRATWLGSLGAKLLSSWYSQRPAAVELPSPKTGQLLPNQPRVKWSTQGTSVAPLASVNVTLSPEAWNGLVITRWKRSGKRVGSLNLGAMGGSVGVDWTEAFPKELSFEPMRLAAAWRIAFNPSYPHQGFYRFFDSGSSGTSPPSGLLEDMVTLAESSTL